MRLPAYGTGSLADVMPSVAARLGVPGCTDALGLPERQRFVVLLVDGLGWELLRESEGLAPVLGEAAGRSITVGAPSTTVASLTSLGTGLPPGGHGVAGLTMRDDSTNRIFCPLVWDTPTPPEELQPHPTVFERAAEAGVTVTTVLPARFEHSGLTRAGLRGGVFSAVATDTDDDAKVSQAAAAARASDRTLVYVYERLLDHAGHAKGVGSREWRTELVRVDRLVRRLRDALSDDTVLLVTGDHGMIDVPPSTRLVFEDEPDLQEGVRSTAGEARFRHVFTANPREVADRWAEVLGDRAWVRTQGDAVDEGWFGPMDRRVAARFGDVVVAMRDRWALLTEDLPGEFSLVGMHGSLTSTEVDVPLLLP